MKRYMVETVSVFRHRYVVEAKESDHACDEVLCNSGDLKEFSQYHVDENIWSVVEFDNDQEYIEMFDQDNSYLKDWDNERKFSFVNKINYKE